MNIDGGGDFGRRVSAALKARGLSLRAASRIMNYDPSYLSRVIKGTQTPSPEYAAALDQLLGAEGTLVDLAASMTEDDRERIHQNLAEPTRLDAKGVRALAGVLAAQRRLDDAWGPVINIAATEAQMDTVKVMLRQARGPHRAALTDVVAEYVQFGGWLHASARNDARALSLLIEAEDLAKEADSGPLKAQVANFRGYVARQQGRPAGTAKWFEIAYNTPGAHVSQRMGDAAQAAQGYALIGQRDRAKELLHAAEDLSDAASDQPPGTAYWLTPEFQRLNLGLARMSLGEYSDAADHLRSGLAGLPADQQVSAWSQEYRDALTEASSH